MNEKKDVNGAGGRDKTELLVSGFYLSLLCPLQSRKGIISIDKKPKMGRQTI